MMSLKPRFFFVIFSLFLLSACSPHPGTGVWKALADNEMGIERLVVGFEGRAEFVSKKQDNANWHCFWGKLSDTELSLDCTPSTNIELHKDFILTANDQGQAELREVEKEGSSPLATFSRLDENPSPRKK